MAWKHLWLVFLKATLVGHHVPAWYVTLEDDELKELGVYNDCDHWVVARNEDEV